MTLGRVVEGVNEVGDEEISRAGLGNVLYVDPREVYLYKRGDKPSCIMMIDWQNGCLLPLII